MRRYEVWEGATYCGIFWEDEVGWLFEAGENITITCLDD